MDVKTDLDAEEDTYSNVPMYMQMDMVDFPTATHKEGVYQEYYPDGRRRGYITVDKVRQIFRCYGLEVVSKTDGDKEIFVMRTPDGEDYNGPPGYQTWVNILFRNLHGLMRGELGCFVDPSALTDLTAPLRDPDTEPNIIIYVTSVLSLPFIMEKPKKDITKIIKVYYEVNLVNDLVYATKTITKSTGWNWFLWRHCFRSSGNKYCRPSAKITELELEGLTKIYALISGLITLSDKFIPHFCDATIKHKAVPLLQKLLRMGDRRNRITIDVLGIMISISRHAPEYADLVEKIFLGVIRSDGDLFEMRKLLMNPSMTVESRTRWLIKRVCSNKLTWPFPSNSKRYLDVYNLLTEGRWFTPKVTPVWRKVLIYCLTAPCNFFERFIP